MLYVSLFPAQAYAEFQVETKNGDKTKFKRKLNDYMGTVATIQDSNSGMYGRYMLAIEATGDGFIFSNPVLG
jgi:hypothetical protein